MSKIFSLPTTVLLFILTMSGSDSLLLRSQNDYEQNLTRACAYYLKKEEIPEPVLIKLVPNNHSELSMYYQTTGPNHKIGQTDFFY